MLLHTERRQRSEADVVADLARRWGEPVDGIMHGAWRNWPRKITIVVSSVLSEARLWSARRLLKVAEQQDMERAERVVALAARMWPARMVNS